ncbi:hypothetical protein U9M48_033151 [Paspalum notatum var. saurae]|uniref:Vacuolar ATPase assembly protein VMA22 n=1 Tax=Paspalum notatum var. saurae TaxID=547442 RepID=A0AAQ3U6R3_PASNO
MATEEALRLPKSVPVVEGVGQIDRVVGEEGRPRGGDDEEILRFMDSVDDYLLLMDSLNSALRQGWLDLASARHSMGPSRVSSTVFDHKEQSAATKLQVVDHADLKPSELKPHFALSKWSLREEFHSTSDVSQQANTEPKLRHRATATTPEDGNHERDGTTNADTSSHVQRARLKTLSVFGALVSPKLRTAQISFETALELIVELANSRSNMLASLSQLKE